MTITNAVTIKCENELPPSENETADRQNFLADRWLGIAGIGYNLFSVNLFICVTPRGPYKRTNEYETITQ